MSLLTNTVGYWKFDEGSGTVTVDSTSNGNNGSLSGAAIPTWSTSGIINDALSFNGTTAWVSVKDSSSLDFSGSAVSISAWVKQTDNNPNRPVISKRTSYSSTGIPYELTIDGTNSISWRVIGNSSNLNYGTELTTNTWYHVGATYDGTTQIIWVNGTNVKSQSRSGTFTTNNHVLMIGTDNESSEWFKGTIDEIGLWSRALSSSEISSLYNNGVGLSYPFGPTNVVFKTLLGVGQT